MSDSATFRAAFPCIQSAIKIHGSGDGMRIQFDIPASEMAEAVKLLAWGQRVLVVTVEPEKQVKTGGETRDVEARPKRKSEWATAEKPGAD